MNDQYEPRVSALSRSVTEDGVTVNIEIYEDGNGDWLLEVVDHLDGSTVWDQSFPTEEAALNEALKTIREEGIRSFAFPGKEAQH